MKVTLDLDQRDLESMLLAEKYSQQIARSLTWTIGKYNINGFSYKYYLSYVVNNRHVFLWKDVTVHPKTYDFNDRFNVFTDTNVMSGVFHSWDEIVCWCVSNGIRFDTDVKLCHDQYETFFFKKKDVAFGPQFPDEEQAVHWMKHTTNEPWLIEGSDPFLAFNSITPFKDDWDMYIPILAKAFHVKEESWAKLLQKQQ